VDGTRESLHFNGNDMPLVAERAAFQRGQVGSQEMPEGQAGSGYVLPLCVILRILAQPSLAL
jgi:hypothetical protein